MKKQDCCQGPDLELGVASALGVAVRLWIYHEAVAGFLEKLTEAGNHLLSPYPTPSTQPVHVLDCIGRRLLIFRYCMGAAYEPWGQFCRSPPPFPFPVLYLFDRLLEKLRHQGSQRFPISPHPLFGTLLGRHKQPRLNPQVMISMLAAIPALGAAQY